MIGKTKLEKLISSTESSKKDFKEFCNLKTEDQKKEFAKDVSAIANSPGTTGYLIYGINNQKQIVGITSSSFKEEQMQQIISSRINPPVKFSAYIIKHSGHNIGVVEIPFSVTKPHQHKNHGAFFIRRGTITGHMTTQEITSSMLRKIQIERYRLGTYDGLTQSFRVSKIRSDVGNVLQDFNFSKKDEFTDSYPTYGEGDKIFTADIFHRNQDKIKLYVNVFRNSNNPNRYDLERYNDFFLSELLDRFRVRKNQKPWLNIFIFLTYQTISSHTIKKRIDNIDHLGITHLDSSTLYQGLGEIDYEDCAMHKRVRLFINLRPIFFIMKVRSEQDIVTRLTLILNFIDEKKNIFRIIRKSQIGKRV